MLEAKVEKILLNAIANNASRRRLTQYELIDGKEFREERR